MLTTKEDIINRKVIMLKADYNAAKLAKAIGCSTTAILLAINCKTISLKLHRKITDILGVSLVDFWPELYGPIVNNISHDATVNESLSKNNG